VEHNVVAILSVLAGTVTGIACGPWARTRAVAGRKHLKDVKELVRVTQRRMVIGGYTVPVANLPYTMASDGATMMADEGYPFAAAYFDRADCRVFFLRSRQVEVAIDVGTIAMDVGVGLGFGGGGRKHAADFQAPLGWEGE